MDTREWGHKLLPLTFIQAKNKGNKHWHTGLWKRKLKGIADGKAKGSSGHVRAQTRARYILAKRNNLSTDVACADEEVPHKSISFFPFEENIDHQINEAIVMIVTGISGTFFENPYVRQLLHDLQPRHRPVFRKKMAQLVRCAIDESAEEVNVSRSFITAIESSRNVLFTYACFARVRSSSGNATSFTSALSCSHNLISGGVMTTRRHSVDVDWG